VVRRVTLADVARAAGVHRTTVSLALRNHSGLPAPTRARLKALAEEMGYRPDPALAALNAYRVGRAEHKNVVAVAYLQHLDPENDLGAACHGLYLEGARAQAERLGYRLERFSVGDDGVNARQLGRILHARGIQGILIASFTPDMPTLELDWSRHCGVRIGHHPAGLPLNTVAHNFFQITSTAVARAYEKGYTRVGLAVSDMDTKKQAQLIGAGFELGLDSHDGLRRVPRLTFAAHDARGRAGIIHDLRAWARREQIEVLLSNWNFPASELATIFDGLPGRPRFYSLDAPSDDLRIGGMVQNHRLLGRHAFDQLALQMQTGAVGIPEYPVLSLIEGFWREPRDDPPSSARSRSRRSEARKSRELFS
jgi:LacI family transcriptional regulator